MCHAKGYSSGFIVCPSNRGGMGWAYYAVSGSDSKGVVPLQRSSVVLVLIGATIAVCVDLLLVAGSILDSGATLFLLDSLRRSW